MLRADRYEQRQYSKYLEREHAPQHTLHDALLRIRKRKGGKANGNNAKKRPRDAPKDEDFQREYSHYLDHDHPVPPSCLAC